MGRRKISFDPPARFFGALVFKVMKVSLCGPHSLETSTLGPTEAEVLCPAFPFGECVERYWYLFHQLGLSGVLVWPMATKANKRKKARTICRFDARIKTPWMEESGAASDHKWA